MVVSKRKIVLRSHNVSDRLANWALDNKNNLCIWLIPLIEVYLHLFADVIRAHTPLLIPTFILFSPWALGPSFVKKKKIEQKRFNP